MPRPKLPPSKGKDADPNALAQFMDHVFDHDAPLRRIQRSVQNRAAAYYVGKQWIEPIEDGGTGGEQLRGVNWKPLSSDIEGIPMPVQNEIFPEVTREAGLLVGVGSQPYIRPEGNDPDCEDGAKLAKDALLTRLEDLGWLEQQQEGGHDCSLLGTWCQASYWDIDRTKTTRIPVKGAVGCPECDFKLASRELDPESGQRIAAARPGSVDVHVSDVESPNPLAPPVPAKYLAKTCATCTTHRGMAPLATGEVDPTTGAPITMDAEVDLPGAPLLEPVDITEEEAKSGKDFVGRDLGEDIALGDTALEVIHPNDAFPDPHRHGLDSYPERWEEFAWEIPRSLDWLRARWKNGRLVKAQEGAELWEHHPVVGSVEGLAAAMGSGVFEDHALWRLFAKKPYMAEVEGQTDANGEAVWAVNRGRLVIMANGIVLFDGDLMFESLNNPGVLIPRFHFDWTPWEHRRRQAHGIGMAEIAFSQQDYINTTKSQWMDAQHRGGSPKWIAEDGVTFTYVGGAGSGYDSDFLFFTRDDPTKAPPEEFAGQTMDSKFLEAIERDVTALKRTMMRSEVDSGEPPKGVDAFSALQLLEKKSNEGRKPRVERLRAMKRRIYKHQLELMHEFYREERYYRVRGKNDKWSVKAFRGLDLHGQTNVMFEDEPIIDAGIARRTGIRQGLEIGSVKAGTAAANRRINRHLEIPLDINEDENNQVELAETELSEWFKEGVEPFIDEDGDDSMTHWQVHKEELGREERRDMKKLCLWSKVLAATWGWKKQLQAIEMAEMQPPVPPPQTMAARPDEYAMAQQKYDQGVQMAQQIAMMPKPIEYRIEYLWDKAIAAAGIDVAISMNPEAVEAMRQIKRAEAHAAGHFFIAQKKMQEAAAGMAAPAAPGGAQTSTGSMPAPGEAAAAPPGADAAAVPM